MAFVSYTHTHSPNRNWSKPSDRWGVHFFSLSHKVPAVGFQTNEHTVRVRFKLSLQSRSLKLGCKPMVRRYKVARMHRQLLAAEKSKASKWITFLSFKIDHLRHIIADGNICHPNGASSQIKKQNSYSRVSTFKWASASSSWLELEGEGVADLLPGGEGEPWGSTPRLTCRFSCVSALMGLGSIGGELFIRAGLRL